MENILSRLDALAEQKLKEFDKTIALCITNGYCVFYQEIPEYSLEDWFVENNIKESDIVVVPIEFALKAKFIEIKDMADIIKSEPLLYGKT